MLNIAADIHGCALQPARWPDVLGEIFDHLHARGGMLWSHQATPDAFGLWVPCRLHPESLAEYSRHYHQKDVWLQAYQARGVRSGEVVTGDMLVPRASFLRSAFYRDFLRRYDYVHLLFGVLHRQETADALVPNVHVSIYRGQADAPFNDTDREKLQALLPHLQQATAVNFHLADRDHRLATAQSAVNMLHPALFLADGAGHIVQSNQAAEGLLAENDGLSLKDNRLQAAKAADHQELNRLFMHGTHASGKADALLYITRPSGKKPYIAVRIRMTEHSRKAPDARRPYQILLVHDPEGGRVINLAALRARYALTSAECGILEALVKVGSPKAIAAHMGNSENTVRTHLKSIFSKTGAHRQSELIQLALAVPNF
jgi:DNA-binding CsgD family transcriptional regulator